MLADYLNRFLHTAAPRHNVLGNQKFLAWSDGKAASKDKAPCAILFREYMPFLEMASDFLANDDPSDGR
jgi:hypothetical protein